MSKKKQKKKSSFLGTVINPPHFHKSQLKFYAIILPLALVMLLPIVYTVSHAFKPLDELYAYPPKFFARRWTLDNFKSLFQIASQSGVPFFRYLFNSIVVTSLVIVCSILIGSLAAFSFSFLEYKGKKLLFAANQLAIMFVAVAVAVPRFIVMSKLGLTNNMLSHVIPLLAMPVGVFLVKQFMDQLPRDLYDASMIDGANRWQKMWYISIPHLTTMMCVNTIMSGANILKSDIGLFFYATMDNTALWDATDVIDTYIWRILRKAGNFQVGTAVGLVQGVFGLGLTLLANWIVRKIDESSALY